MRNFVQEGPKFSFGHLALLKFSHEKLKHFSVGEGTFLFLTILAALQYVAQWSFRCSDRCRLVSMAVKFLPPGYIR